MTKTILETCDIWDTDYNSDNWEPEIMTIFVMRQLSIRNSCDVFLDAFPKWDGWIGWMSGYIEHYVC